MTRLQRLQLKQSEQREALGKLLDAEEQDSEAIGAVTKELRDIEGLIQAAILVEPDPPTDTRETREETPESRELRDLIAAASIVDFLVEADGGPAPVGASLELRTEVLGDNAARYMPLEMLLDDAPEQRVDAVTNIGTAIQDTQMPIAGRVFARSAAEYLGVSSPTVPVGTISYPRLNAGTTADVRSPSVELDGTAATLETVSIDPVRLTASYTFSTESLTKVRGFEEALRRDIRGVLSEKRDDLAINGQAAVAATSPKIDGIINSLTDPTNPTANKTALQILADYDAAVDGKYASTADQVRLLVNPDTYRYALGLQIPLSGQLLRDRLDASRFRVSANMPATVSMDATVLRYAAGANARGMFQAIWAGLELIVDPYTLAKKGQRVLTAVMHVGQDLVETSAYGRLEWQVA